jgi:hypothetical protein
MTKSLAIGIIASQRLCRSCLPRWSENHKSEPNNDYSTVSVSTTDNGTSANHHPEGWRRYVYSTNHKDIGTMYLVFAIVAGVIGGAFSIAMRVNLQQPGMHLFSVQAHVICRFECSRSPRVWAETPLVPGHSADRARNCRYKEYEPD